MLRAVASIPSNSNGCGDGLGAGLFFMREDELTQKISFLQFIIKQLEFQVSFTWQHEPLAAYKTL